MVVDSGHCLSKQQNKCGKPKTEFLEQFIDLSVLLQLLRWRCGDCVVHLERYVREEQKYICVA